MPTGESLYRHCSPEHHHHVVCRSCGAAEEIREGAIEDWVARVGGEHGYTQLTHSVEIYGLCAVCAA
nr:transcriptional repressor [Actinomadura atramentaria]